MGRIHARRPRRALAAAAIFGMVGGSLAMMGTAHAAVMLSGSTIDSTGNYVDGTIEVLNAEGATVTSVSTSSGTFDIPLEDGTYKLRFGARYGAGFASEYYRDKVDLATADVVTVSGSAQTLPAWTIDRHPSVVGVLRTTDGRVVRSGFVQAYDATSGDYVGYDVVDGSGSFRVGGTSTAVKLQFSGSDPNTGRALATEWFNDKGSKATADPVGTTPEGNNVGVVALAPAGTISGRVTNEFGTPLYRALVCADLTESQNQGGQDPCDFTNTSGAYTIEGVATGDHEVRFIDSVEEYKTEYWNNVPTDQWGFPVGTPNLVTVAPGQAVTGVDAALAARPSAPPQGVDLSGTVRDELGGVGIGYTIIAYDTPADPRDKQAVARTVSNRVGQYHFSQLDRIGGETEFKIEVIGDSPREEGDFARRTIWSGDKLGYDSAVAITAAPRVLDFVQPVAGGIAGAVTSEAGGVPRSPSVRFRDADQNNESYGAKVEGDGTYDHRELWAGTYTVQFNAEDHVSEWWKDAVAGKAKTITVKPGQVVTGISAALAKDVKAIERPKIRGNAWVGKSLTLGRGAWTTEADSKFTYEWLVGNAVIATGPTLKVRKSHLGKKITGRVTNDAGFTQGQAITAATAKVGYKPKLKTVIKGRVISVLLKAKPLKAKKVKAAIVVYELKGKKANGEPKLKKLGKGKVTKGKGVIRLKKALTKGKHKLVFRIKGKGKVGSGDLIQKIKR